MIKDDKVFDIKDVVFNIGDVVQLNSGGLNMTVTSIEREGLLIVCQWFEADEHTGLGQVKKVSGFPKKALKHCE